MHKLVVSLVLATSIISASALPVATVSAASAAGFQAGRIMDDSVMSDEDSMTVNDIQNFLNSKVPSCDTNGSQNSEMNNSGIPDYNNNGSIQRWEWGKKKYNQTTFPCLKNKVFSNGKKAAKIIYDSSQSYSINPKVMLVLLQKEQGLVTDTWPLNIQYRSATGYGCPDTAPCNSEYYGLINQVKKAASLFRTVLDGGWSNYPVGNNSIPWNPNTDVCGYSTVNIQNRATSALYRYTPYRPNQAALNAGYGTGNGCSSYGNRNFYLYYTDWFGSTTIPLFKISGGGGTIYLSYGDNYYAIPSYDVLKAWGLQDKKVKTIDSSQLSSYTQGADLSRTVRFGASPAVFLVDDGNLFYVPAWSTANAYGYFNTGLKTYPDTNLQSMLSSKGNLTQLAKMRSGAAYLVNSTGKHLFPDAQTYSSQASSLAGTTESHTFSDDLIDPIASGAPVLLDGKFVKAKDSSAVYLHDQGELHWLSAEIWNAWGRKLDYGYFTNASLTQIPMSSTPAPILIDNGTNKYLVNSGKKQKVTSTVQVAWGLDNSDFSAITPSASSKLTTGSELGSLVRNPSGTVFVLLDGEKLPIPSMEDFDGLKLSWSNVQTLQSGALDLVPTSTSYAFSPTSLIRLPDGSVSWIDSGFTMHTIPSEDIFNSYGFRWKSVRNFDTGSLDAYTNSTLQRLFNSSSSGKHYLADKGKRLSISSTAYGSSQYDLSGAPQTNISNLLITSIVKGADLTNFIQGSSATVYKVVNGQKRPISSPSALFSNGGSWSSITKVSDQFLATLTTGSAL